MLQTSCNKTTRGAPESAFPNLCRLAVVLLFPCCRSQLSLRVWRSITMHVKWWKSNVSKVGFSRTCFKIIPGVLLCFTWGPLGFNKFFKQCNRLEKGNEYQWKVKAIEIPSRFQFLLSSQSHQFHGRHLFFVGVLGVSFSTGNTVPTVLHGLYEEMV